MLRAPRQSITEFGLWARSGAGKSAAESKAMAYARWAFKGLSTAVPYRAFLARHGVTQEWKRTMTSRWGSREASMYYMLLVETLTTAFMQTPGPVNQLDKQPRNTLKALNPLQEGIPQLDEKMKIFFESAVITEELFCKPLRVLSANPKMSAFEFKSHCAGILEELEEALENQGKLIELWTHPPPSGGGGVARQKHGGDKSETSKK